MKAITIWQPWASLIAIGAKEYETRSWSTNYRGPIAIHAAKKEPMINGLPEIIQKAVRAVFHKRYGSRLVDPTPTGCIVAVAELVEVIRTKDHLPSEQEEMFGDWSPGRFAWKFANVTILSNPTPVSGRQGLWDWEETP